MVGPAILLLCTNLAMSHKDTRLACQKGFEAALVQTGQDKRIKKYAKRKELEYRQLVGEDAALFFIAFHTIAIKKEFNINLRGFATANSAVLRVNAEETSINLNWRF
jgi:hypothetical protein